MDIMPPFLIPQCDDASVIVNKAALSVMALSGCKFSEEHFICGFPFSAECTGRLLHLANVILAKSKDYQRLSRAFVQCGDRFEYIYSVVRCGKCVKCRHSKQVDLINRVQMESACYDCPCYMITLTYDEKSLPCHRVPWIKSNTLYYKDVQDFLKRLRIKWHRAGLPTDFRYLVAGEYGHERGRPHYHLLLWNNPYKASDYAPATAVCHALLGHRKLYDDIFNTWGMCTHDAFQCEPAGDGAAAYVSKYITKQALYKLRGKVGFAPPFIHQSTAAGGIGAPMMRAAADYYRANPTVQEFTFRTYDGDVKSVHMSSVMKRMYYPSLSRQVPAWYRQEFRSLVDVLHHMYACNMIQEKEVVDILNHYRHGVLTYRLDLPAQDAPSDVLGIYLPHRLIQVYTECTLAMDKYCPALDGTLDMRHRLAVIPQTDARSNYAGIKARLTANIFASLSKERL